MFVDSTPASSPWIRPQEIVFSAFPDSSRPTNFNRTAGFRVSGFFVPTSVDSHFDVVQLSGNDERAAHLQAQRLILLDQEVTEETAAIITLIDIWLQNPMDGAGS